MTRFRPLLRCIVALLVCTSLAAAAGERPRIVAYVPNWIDLDAFAKTIDYSKVTHLNIAFENPRDDTGDLSFDPRNDALISAAHRHGVKVLVSIGGGSASENSKLRRRYFGLITPKQRAAFVAHLADYVERHRFDGLDVDLEGPAINADYGAFIAALADALQPTGRLLTSALSKGYGGARVPDAALGRFDFVNIMAYDSTGPWDPQTPGQHSSLELARDSVDYWLKRGLPKERAVLGVPFYGYGFGEAFRKQDYSYREIIAAYPGAENADETARTIWYNGLPTIRAKSRLVVEKQLGGVMIWPLDYDAQGEKSLLTAIHETLTAPAPTIEPNANALPGPIPSNGAGAE